MAQAQLVIIAAALRATARSSMPSGHPGSRKSLRWTGIGGDARTLASHNPRVYKARILGDWLINGKDPVPDLAALGRGGQGN